MTAAFGTLFAGGLVYSFATSLIAFIYNAEWNGPQK